MQGINLLHLEVCVTIFLCTAVSEAYLQNFFVVRSNCSPSFSRQMYKKSKHELVILRYARGVRAKNWMRCPPSFFRLSSKPFWFGDFDEGKVDIISYLPITEFEMPPRTEYVLKKLTEAFIKGDITFDYRGDITLDDITVAIEDEYKFVARPCHVGDYKMYGHHPGRNGSRISSSLNDTTKILAFTALNRVPIEIVTTLLKLLKSEVTDANVTYILGTIIEEMETVGWEAVSFPQGLPLRVRRDYILSKRKRYNPIPRRTPLTRSQDILDAKTVIREAMNTKPPPKIVDKRKMLAEIDQIAPDWIVKSQLSQSPESSLREIIFFPSRINRNRLSRRLMTSSKRYQQRLKHSGTQGLVAYRVLSFLWYSSTFFGSWKLVGFCPTIAKNDFNPMTFQKVAKILASVYIGSRITNTLRVALALSILPQAHKILEYIRRKTRSTREAHES